MKKHNAKLTPLIKISNGDPNAIYTAPTVGAADVIYAGNGNDAVSGGFGNDVIFGEGGNDYLLGDEGNDILFGGKDNDIMDGGAGTDIYIHNRGDGVDNIRETISGNILRFGAGISSSDITLKLGSLMLDLGNGDAIHIEGFDQNDVFNSSSIGGFEFDDGSTLSVTELLERGFDINGTARADILVGTNTTNRISGFGGATNDARFEGERRAA